MVTLRRLVSSGFLSRLAYLIGANILTGVLGYLLHAVIGRLLGPADYGIAASLIAFSTILLFPIQVITTVIARAAAQLPVEKQFGQLHDLLKRTNLALVPAAAILTLGLLVLSKLIASFLHLDSIVDIVLLSLMLPFALLMPVNLGALQGLQRFGAFSIFLILPLLLRLLFSFFLIVNGFGVQGVVLGISISILISYLASFVPVRRIFATPRVTAVSIRSLLPHGFTTAIALGSTVLLYNLDILLAKHFLPEEMAGLYAGVATVGKIVLAVSNGVVVAVFPRFATARKRGSNLLPELMQAIGAVVALCLVVELPFLLIPDFILRLLLGVPFVAVSGVLGFYGAAMILLGIAQIFIYYFLALDDRLFSLVILVSCGLEAILFTLWHHSLWSLVAAIFLTHLFLLIALTYLFVRERKRVYA